MRQLQLNTIRICLKLITKDISQTIMQRPSLLCLEICRSCVVSFRIINFTVEWPRILLCRLVFPKAVFLSCALWEFTIVNFRMGQSVNTFHADKSIEAISTTLMDTHKSFQWSVNIFTRIKRQWRCVQIWWLYPKYLLTIILELNLDKLKQPWQPLRYFTRRFS